MNGSIVWNKVAAHPELGQYEVPHLRNRYQKLRRRREEAARAEADRVAREARAVEEVISRVQGINPAALIEAARRLQAQQNYPECSVGTSDSFRTAQEDGHPTTPPNFEESSR